MFAYFPEYFSKQQPSYAPRHNSSCSRQSNLFHDLLQQYHDEQQQRAQQQAAQAERRRRAEQQAVLRRQREQEALLAQAQQEAALRQKRAKRQQEETVFGDLMESLFKQQLQQKQKSPRSNNNAPVVPTFHVSQDNTQIKVALPKGFNKQLLQVEYDDATQQLSIFAKQHFFKRFAVPSNANIDAITAKWNDEEGALLVTVPLKNKPKTTNINIQQDETAQQVAVSASNKQRTVEKAASPVAEDVEMKTPVATPKTPEAAVQAPAAQEFDEWAPIVEDDPDFVHAPKPKKQQ